MLTRADKAYRLEETAAPVEAPDSRTLAGHGFDRQFRAGARQPALVALDVIAMKTEGS